jgi:hypothetical protein
MIKKHAQRCIISYEVLKEQSLGRPRLRWESNIKLDNKKIGVDCTHLDYDGDHRRVNLYRETKSFVFTSEEQFASIFSTEEKKPTRSRQNVS